jgi:hypothetical protein
MKKLIITFLIVFTVSLGLVYISCNKINTFPLNIPFSVNVVVQGSNNPGSAFTTYCLTQNSTFENYSDKIKKFTFIEAAWRTDSVKNITTGTVDVTVRISGGAILFHKTLPSTNPLAYKSTPYIFTLSPTEIQSLTNYFNAYLQNPNQCLEASVIATVTSGSPPYYLSGNVDIVVEAETNF